MGEQAEQLKARTRQFALDVIKLLKTIPAEEPGPTIRRQLAKAATSVSANHWLDLLGTAGIVGLPTLRNVHQEARELRAIFARSRATATKNRKARR